MVEITSLSDDEEIAAETNYTAVVPKLPNEVALRENKNTKKSVSERLSAECCVSETSDHIYDYYRGVTYYSLVFGCLPICV